MLNSIFPSEEQPCSPIEWYLCITLVAMPWSLILLISVWHHASFDGPTDIGAEDSVSLPWNCALKSVSGPLKISLSRSITDVVSILRTNDVEIYASPMLCYML